MTAQYFTVLTDYGTQAFAKAIATNQPIQFSSFAVGDGNGQAVTPTADRTALVKETHRANVSAVSLDSRNNKQIIIELTIPEDVGGFYIREMGVFDSTNKLVAYANAPESFKPTLESGSGKVQVLRMILKVSNSQAVTLSIDNSVIFVTRQQLNPKKITSSTTNGFDESGHTHEIEKADTTKAGIVQLTDDTGLDSDKLGLSARAGKKLAQLISAVKLALGNYIPNNKKSNSVTSNSREDVATSSAVKTAYDKGVEAKTAADNANQNADGRVSKSGDTMTGNLSLKQGDYSGLNVYNNDGYYTRLEGNPHNANSLLTLAYRTPQGTNIAVVSLPKKHGVVAYAGDVVSKSGDSMSGTLSFSGATDSYRIGSYTWRMPIKFNGDAVIGNEKCAIGFNNNGSLHFGGMPGASQFNATLDADKLWVAGDVKTALGRSLNSSIYVDNAYHDIAFSWLSDGLKIRLDKTDLGRVAFKHDISKSQLVWQGEMSNALTVTLPVDRGILFVCVTKSWGAGTVFNLWLSAPIEHCDNTRLGDQDAGGSGGDYDFTMALLLNKSGRSLKLTPEGARKPIIKKIVVVGI
nr:MAG TPA: tail collar fiber protein [Caudoviricetes sp.]